MSPTARSLRYLRQSGYLADVVERWLPRVNRRRDLFGFADLVAVRRGEPGCLAVQVTSWGHVGDRLARCRRRGELAVWLACGNRFQVHGWGKRHGRWVVKAVEVRGEELQAEVLEGRPSRRRRPRQGDLFDFVAS